MRGVHICTGVFVIAQFVSLACSESGSVTSPSAVDTASTALEREESPTAPDVAPPEFQVPPEEPAAPPPPGAQTASIIALGDTGMCSQRDAVQRTAELAARFPGQLLLLGDLAYDRGSYDEFLNCFDPAWSGFRGRWHPSPGNHDYGTPNAGGYHQYFGNPAAPQGRTYYSLRLGEWLVLMLDSNERAHPGSVQYEFVRNELTRNRTTCALAAWHHPLFSSGPNGANRYMRDLTALLHENGVDVLLTAHDHLYERFAPQDAEGRGDARGIRQFIAGTGGSRLYEAARREPHSQVLISKHGVLRMTLQPGSYDWAFVDISGSTLDTGTDVCH